MRNQDFPGGPAAKTLHFQYTGLRLDPLSGKQIPHAASKYPACCNKDKIPHAAAKTSAVKQTNKYFKKERERNHQGRKRSCTLGSVC